MAGLMTDPEWQAVVEAQRANFQLAFDMQVTYETELELALATFDIDVHAPNWHDKLPKPLPPVVPPVVVPPVDPPPVITPPPVVKRAMPIGGVEADDLEKLIGERLGMYRRYDGDDLDAAKLRSFLAADTGTGSRMRVYSAKGSPAAWTPAVLDLIPQDGKITVIIYENEVERPPKNTDRVAYIANVNQAIINLRAWAASRNRTDVFPGVAHMGYLELDGNAATDTSLWFPTVGLGGDLPVVLELHPYDKGKNTLRSLYTPTLTLWTARGGTLWGIGETGSLGRGDTQEAAWINQGIADAYADECMYFSFFDSALGGTGDWSNTTPAVIAAIAKNAPFYTPS